MEPVLTWESSLDDGRTCCQWLKATVFFRAGAGGVGRADKAQDRLIRRAKGPAFSPILFKEWERPRSPRRILSLESFIARVDYFAADFRL